MNFRLGGETMTGRIARNEPEWAVVETSRGRWRVRHEDAAAAYQRPSSETAEK